jgi:uncharacterized protein YcbX
MLGVELNSSYLTQRGLVGDRAYAVVEKQTGKVASAENPRKWGKLFVRSMYIDSPSDGILPPVRITFPDGSNTFSDHNGNEVNSHLSDIFGREITLMKSSGFEEQVTRSIGPI